MLTLTESPAFICLRYLLTEEYGFAEMNIFVKDYVYFQKNDLAPIQIDSSKVSYTDLELSSYAIHVDEHVEKFSNRFSFVMKTYEDFSKKSKD